MRQPIRIALAFVAATLLGGCGSADESVPDSAPDKYDSSAAPETVYDDMIEQKNAVGPRVEAAQDAHRQQLEDQLSHDEGGPAPAADADP